MGHYKTCLWYIISSVSLFKTFLSYHVLATMNDLDFRDIQIWFKELFTLLNFLFIYFFFLKKKVKITRKKSKNIKKLNLGILIKTWKVSDRRRGGGKCLSACLSISDETCYNCCCSHNSTAHCCNNTCCSCCLFCLMHLWRATNFKLEDEQSFLNNLKSFKIIHNSGKYRVLITKKSHFQKQLTTS